MPLAGAFVSNDDSVKSIAATTLPWRDLGGIDVKSIDVVKLGQLHALMTGKTFQDVLPEFLPEAHVVSDDGPWVYRFPITLQASLAALREPELSQLAERWSKIREFELDRIPAQRVTAILGDFVRLAQTAEGRAERLYLWNSL
jgi:hypothetical protein